MDGKSNLTKDDLDIVVDNILNWVFNYPIWSCGTGYQRDHSRITITAAAPVRSENDKIEIYKNGFGNIFINFEGRTVLELRFANENWDSGVFIFKQAKSLNRFSLKDIALLADKLRIKMNLLKLFLESETGKEEEIRIIVGQIQFVHNYGPNAERISGGSAVEFNASSVINLSGLVSEDSRCKEKKTDPIITLNFLHHVAAPCIIRELKKHFADVRIIDRECCSIHEGRLMRLPDGPNISSHYSVLIGFIDGRPDRTMRYVKLEYWRNCDPVDHSIIGDRNFIRVYATNNQLELVEIMHIGRRKLSDSSAPCRAVATATGGGLKFWDIDTTTMIHDMIDLINDCIDNNYTMVMFLDDKTLTDLGAVPFGLVACTMKNLFEDYAHPSKHYQRQCYTRDQEIIYYDDEQTFEKDPICPVHFGATKLPSGQINVWFIDPSYVGILVQEFHIHKNTDDDGPWAKVLNFGVPDIPAQFWNWKMREKINRLINDICAKINLVCSGYTVHDTPEQKFWSYFKGFNAKAYVDDLNTDVIKSAHTMLAGKQDKQTNEKTEDSGKLVITEGKPMIDVKQWETDEDYKYFNYIRGQFNLYIHKLCGGFQVRQIANSIDEVMWDCTYAIGFRTPKKVHAHIYLRHCKDQRDFNGIADDLMTFFKITDDGKEEKVIVMELDDELGSHIRQKVEVIYDQVRHMIEEDAARKPNISVPFSVVACVLERMLETHEGYRRVCYSKTRFECRVKIYGREYTIGAVKDKFKIIHVFANDPTEHIFFDVINHMSHRPRSIYGSTGSPWTISRIVGMFPYSEPLQNTMKSLSAAINDVCRALTCTDTHDTYFSAYYADDVKPKIDDLSYDIIKESSRIYYEHLKDIVDDFQTRHLGIPANPNMSVLTGKPSTAGRLRPNPEFLWHGMQVLDKSPLMVDTERRGFKDLSVKKVSFEEWVERTTKPVYTMMKHRIVEKTIDVNNIDLNTPGLVSSDDWGRLIHAFHDAKFTVDTEEIKQILRSLKEEKEMSEKKNVAVYKPEILKRWNKDSEYLLFNYVRIAMNNLIIKRHRMGVVQWKGADHIESVNGTSWETKTNPVYRAELVHYPDDDVMSFYEVDPNTGKKYLIVKDTETLDRRFGRGFYAAIDCIYKAVARLKTELQTGEVPKAEDLTTTEKKEEIGVQIPKEMKDVLDDPNTLAQVTETEDRGCDSKSKSNNGKTTMTFSEEDMIHLFSGTMTINYICAKHVVNVTLSSLCKNEVEKITAALNRYNKYGIPAIVSNDCTEITLNVHVVDSELFNTIINMKTVRFAKIDMAMRARWVNPAIMRLEFEHASEIKEETNMSVKRTIGEPKYPHYSTDKNGTKLITLPWDTYMQLTNAQYGIAASVRIIKDRCTEIKEAYWNPKTGTATIIWADGSKTFAKALDASTADPEVGFAICIAKKFFGGTQHQWRKWIKKIVTASEKSSQKKIDKKYTKLAKQAWARLEAEGITDPTQDQVVAYIDKIDAENKAASKAAKAKPATVPAKKTTTPKKKGK